MTDRVSAIGSDTPKDIPVTEAGSGVSGGVPTVSLSEAVDMTGVSRSTLQRRLKAGAVENARRLPDGGWSIPVPSLIAAGLAPRVSPPDPTPGLAARLADAETELQTLRAEVVRLRDLHAAGQEHLADLRQALETVRALTAGDAGEGRPRRRWRR